MVTCDFCKRANPSANHTLTCRILQNSNPSNESLLMLIKILVERIETLEDQRPQNTSQPTNVTLILKNSVPPPISLNLTISLKQSLNLNYTTASLGIRIRIR